MLYGRVIMEDDNRKLVHKLLCTIRGYKKGIILELDIETSKGMPKDWTRMFTFETYYKRHINFGVLPVKDIFDISAYSFDAEAVFMVITGKNSRRYNYKYSFSKKERDMITAQYAKVLLTDD